MTEAEIREYEKMMYQTDEGITLYGYTSCTLSKDTALTFAWQNRESGHAKVLFHFEWKCDVCAYFLNGGAYDHEEEVLLFDGTSFLVDSVDRTNKEYTRINLKYQESN